MTSTGMASKTTGTGRFSGVDGKARYSAPARWKTRDTGIIAGHRKVPQMEKFYGRLRTLPSAARKIHPPRV
jgi:hypothetical protein